MVKKSALLVNKKGSEMAISTIIITIISVVLLILLVTFLTGGFTKFGEKIGPYFTSSNVDNIIQSCNALVSNEFNYEYCCINKTVKISSRLKSEMTCDIAKNESWGHQINSLRCENVC